jgi:hypothetical protein
VLKKPPAGRASRQGSKIRSARSAKRVNTVLCVTCVVVLRTVMTAVGTRWLAYPFWYFLVYPRGFFPGYSMGGSVS